MTQPTTQLNRRQFVQTLSAGAVSLIPATAVGRSGVAPGNRINIGVIGLGSRGYNLLDEFLQNADAQVTAICDVDEFHYRDRVWGRGLAHGRTPGKRRVEVGYAKQKSSTLAKGLGVYSDYRQLLEHTDLDAVVVATPDHWHAKCTIDALKAGLDVYCEKPVTHLFHEGQLVYREVAKRKAVFQTGSQQRSMDRFQRAVELVLNGHIGKIQRVEVGLPPGYAKPQGETKVGTIPKTLDYDMWCGPSTKLPYVRARHHRWWRGHRAYGGGVLMDWIGHHNDIAHWAMGMDRSGPTKVEAVEWTFPKTDVYNSPRHYTIQCEYRTGVASTISSRNTQGTKFIGDQGWIHVNRNKLSTSDGRLLSPKLILGQRRVFKPKSHTDNFLKCVRSRTDCVCTAETGHRSITPGHLAYVSHALKRALRWDAANEVVIDDDEANKLLASTDYREPWTLL